MRWLVGMLGLLSVAASAVGAESWRVHGPAAGATVSGIGRGLDGAEALAFNGTVAGGDGWLSLAITTADGRSFAWSDRVRRRADSTISVRVPLHAGHWRGAQALGGDALAMVASITVSASGGATGLDGELSGIGAAGPATAIVELGVFDRGPWRERRFRLLPAMAGERGTVAVEVAGRSVPAFLHQSGMLERAGWTATEPAAWAVRLRPGEAADGPVRVSWRHGDAEQAWDLPATPLRTSAALPAAMATLLPPLAAPPWSGPLRMRSGDGWRRLPGTLAGDALAPLLAGPLGWTGMRGGETAWPQAAACDAAAASGVSEVDLLPRAWADEQGRVRFGTLPWSGPAGWTAPQAAWTDHRQLLDHARQVVARTRAAPGLRGWRASWDLPADGAPAVAGMQALFDGLAALAAADGLPMRAAHPQLDRFARGERGDNDAWFSFEQGDQGWRIGPLPWTGRPRIVDGGTHGAKSLAWPLTGDGGIRAGGVVAAIDASLFNLDRLALDARVEGGGSAVWYAACTDDGHRWFQQRLRDLTADGSWGTLLVDFADDARWESVGHAQPWGAEVRRRVRTVALSAWQRDSTAQTSLAGIDRVRRLGWPDVPPRTATISERTAPAAAIACWQPLALDADISPPPANPYDPEHADVVAEIIAPDGSRSTHPAYWHEPWTLATVGDPPRETAVKSGPGWWRLRRMADRPGTWRWRLAARIKDREAMLAAEGPWHETLVSAGSASMPPIRQSADPGFFERADGRPWVPLGINLRSPGDTRQIRVLRQQRQLAAPLKAGQPPPIFDDAVFTAMGTAAYERWLPVMAANGVDFARVWMCPWFAGLEWRRDWDGFGGLGVYNQHHAAQLDRVCELAGGNGVYLQVEIQNHGMTGVWADGDWEHSPYNAALGGPCRNPGEWFTRDEAWRQHEKRLRYTVARWGWRPEIAAWSITSEIEFTGLFDQETGRNDRGESPGTRAWVDRSIRWFKANDPQRPTSFHTSHPWTALDIWRQVDGLGFSYSNAYSAFQEINDTLGTPQRRGARGGRDLPLALRSYFDIYDPSRMRRPVLVGEWGGHWSDNSPRNLASELRAGLWTQAVLPYAGNTGFWWWLWVDAAQSWDAYGSVARYMRGFDPRGRGFRPARLQPVRRTEVDAHGMISADEIRCYALVRGSDQQPVDGVGDGGDLIVEALAPGSRWRSERWDPATGAVVGSATSVQADQRGRLRVVLGRLDPDAAFIIKREAP